MTDEADKAVKDNEPTEAQPIRPSTYWDPNYIRSRPLTEKEKKIIEYHENLHLEYLRLRREKLNKLD